MAHFLHLILSLVAIRRGHGPSAAAFGGVLSSDQPKVKVLHEFERLRYFQDRHWPLEFAHHGAHECRALLRRVVGGTRTAGSHDSSNGAIVWLARLDRPRALY